MATKTIPQLTLRASLTDASMFEIDDGIQSYRITATQIVTYLQTKELITAAAMISDGIITAAKLASDSVTTAKLAALAVTNAKLDNSYIHDLTAVTPVAADYLALADASDSNKKKKASVGDIRNAVYRSVTSTDSVGADDETMKLSGASFTSTLPTAAGVTGKRYKFIHAGTSLTQVYTLATTSSQTIGGVAGGSYKLCTNGEVLEIESDGANWIIVNHVTATAWVDAGGLVIGGSTSGPTKASATVIDKVRWRRVANMAHIIMDYRHTSSTGTAVGSGDYLFTMPTGIVIDTAVVSAEATAQGTGNSLRNSNVGTYMGNYSTSHNDIGYAAVWDSTKVTANVGSVVAGTPAVGTIGSGYHPISGAANWGAHLNLWIPVVDWQP